MAYALRLTYYEPPSCMVDDEQIYSALKAYWPDPFLFQPNVKLNFFRKFQ